jgi:hypothetical protein
MEKIFLTKYEINQDTDLLLFFLTKRDLMSPPTALVRKENQVSCSLPKPCPRTGTIHIVCPGKYFLQHDLDLKQYPAGPIEPDQYGRFPTAISIECSNVELDGCNHKIVIHNSMVDAIRVAALPGCQWEVQGLKNVEVRNFCIVNLDRLPNRDFGSDFESDFYLNTYEHSDYQNVCGAGVKIVNLKMGLFQDLFIEGTQVGITALSLIPHDPSTVEGRSEVPVDPTKQYSGKLNFDRVEVKNPVCGGFLFRGTDGVTLQNSHVTMLNSGTNSREDLNTRYLRGGIELTAYVILARECFPKDDYFNFSPLAPKNSMIKGLSMTNCGLLTFFAQNFQMMESKSEISSGEYRYSPGFDRNERDILPVCFQLELETQGENIRVDQCQAIMHEGLGVAMCICGGSNVEVSNSEIHYRSTYWQDTLNLGPNEREGALRIEDPRPSFFFPNRIEQFSVRNNSISGELRPLWIGLVQSGQVIGNNIQQSIRQIGPQPVRGEDFIFERKAIVELNPDARNVKIDSNSLTGRGIGIRLRESTAITITSNVFKEDMIHTLLCQGGSGIWAENNEMILAAFREGEPLGNEEVENPSGIFVNNKVMQAKNKREIVIPPNISNPMPLRLPRKMVWPFGIFGTDTFSEEWSYPSIGPPYFGTPQMIPVAIREGETIVYDQQPEGFPVPITFFRSLRTNQQDGIKMYAGEVVTGEGRFLPAELRTGIQLINNCECPFRVFFRYEFQLGSIFLEDYDQFIVKMNGNQVFSLGKTSSGFFESETTVKVAQFLEIGLAFGNPSEILGEQVPPSTVIISDFEIIPITFTGFLPLPEGEEGRIVDFQGGFSPSEWSQSRSGDFTVDPDKIVPEELRVTFNEDATILTVTEVCHTVEILLIPCLFSRL